MKKIMDLEVRTNRRLSENHIELVLSSPNTDLPEIKPGQFVNVAVPNSKTTFLRRPISICLVSADWRELTLLIRLAGDGTKALAELPAGAKVNVVLPLGNSFPLDNISNKKVLLIGGGVGVAPLLNYGEWLKAHGAQPVFALGARSVSEILLLDEFRSVGEVTVATEDGSHGTKGFVTECDCLNRPEADVWVCCGPLPMMKAIAALARKNEIPCYVSLENVMACGLGACLCCVEKTVKGNVCVCTSGPIFNINELLW